MTGKGHVMTGKGYVVTGKGHVVIGEFCRGGLERGREHRYFCNTTWGHLLVCLKDYCVRGVKIPISPDFHRVGFQNYFPLA